MTRLFVILLVAVGGVRRAPGADAACQPVTEAYKKLTATPVHEYMSESAEYTAGKTGTSELVYVNHLTFIQVGGRWRVSPMSEKDRQGMRDAANDPKRSVTCKLIGDQAVSGEAAVMYSIHQQTTEDQIDTRVWVSRTRGLPLKDERDVNVGGMAGKSHRATRYDYANVQAPAAVR